MNFKKNVVKSNFFLFIIIMLRCHFNSNLFIISLIFIFIIFIIFLEVNYFNLIKFFNY